MELYPEMSFTDDKGKTHTERANKYFIMLGEDGDTKGLSLAERRYNVKSLDSVCSVNANGLESCL